MEPALKAIADRRRRGILRLVNEREMTAGRIASHFRGVSREAISRHLRVLKDAGLLTERRQGTRRFYCARAEGLAEVRAFLDQFWTPCLDRLKAEAERRERSKRHGRQG